MAKFKYPKQPKAPKATASIAQHEKYADKMKDWKKACAEIDKDKSAHEKAKKRTADLKAGKGLSGRKR